MFSGKKIVATIEARMTSSRLPGKVLLPLAGKPTLERLVERMKSSKYVDTIVVATTVNEADEPIAGLAERLGVACFRGSEEDVLGRVLGAAQSVQGGIIVEITGDCPLVDGRLIDRAVEEFFKLDVHYASNCLIQSYPLGFEVQVFPTAVLAEVDKLTQDPVDRLHVSYYIYMHPERYRFANWTAEPECFAPDFRLTLDEKGDYELLDKVFTALAPGNPDFSAAETVAYLKSHPELLELNKSVRQKHAQEG